MDWLVDNWLFVGAGIVIVVLIYVFSQNSNSGSKQSTRSSGVSRSGSNRNLTEAEKDRAFGLLLTKLSEALETVVDDAVGRYYNRQDREKIAMGMIAVMAAESISLDRMTSDGKLFAEVMLKSIATLTQMGEISTR